MWQDRGGRRGNAQGAEGQALELRKLQLGVINARGAHTAEEEPGEIEVRQTGRGVKRAEMWSRGSWSATEITSNYYSPRQDTHH
jgi:hypothetical protein